jgi:hypothetical protein
MNVLGMQSCQLNIQSLFLHKLACLTVGGGDVVGQSGVLHRGYPKGSSACPPGGAPHDISDD